MAKASVRVKIDNNRVRALVTSTGAQATTAAMNKTVKRVQDNITSSGRVHTGAMRSGIRGKIVYRGLVTTASVYSNQDYTIFQDQGTRAHGPVTAPFLVFRIRGAGPLIFAKRVRGVTAARFFERALDAVKASDFKP